MEEKEDSQETAEGGYYNQKSSRRSWSGRRSSNQKIVSTARNTHQYHHQVHSRDLRIEVQTAKKADKPKKRLPRPRPRAKRRKQLKTPEKKPKKTQGPSPRSTPSDQEAEKSPL